MNLASGDDTHNYILKDKYNDNAEIEMLLFYKCNLTCNFCGQDHDSEVGMTPGEVNQKVHIIKDFMNSTISKDIYFSMMGGELFADYISDEMIDSYYGLAMAAKEIGDRNGQKVKFSWVSNFAYEKNQRVLDFILKCRDQGIETYISTSYDLTGRPLDKTKKSLHHKNLMFFKDYVRMVGLTMTAPSIKFLLNRKDPYFDEVIYPNFHTHFDYYVPEHKAAAHLIPSDKQQQDMYLHLIDNYPNADPVKGWLEDRGDIRSMSCMCSGPNRKVTVLPDGRTAVCRYREDYGKDFFIEDVDLNDMSNIVKSYMKRHDCLGCEYFNKCEFTCFVQADYKDKERMDECLYIAVNKKLDEMRGTVH